MCESHYLITHPSVEGKPWLLNDQRAARRQNLWPLGAQANVHPTVLRCRTCDVQCANNNHETILSQPSQSCLSPCASHHQELHLKCSVVTVTLTHYILLFPRIKLTQFARHYGIQGPSSLQSPLKVFIHVHHYGNIL